MPESHKYTYTIFTDGSSRGNPGDGGWGSIVVGKKAGSDLMYVVEMGGAQKDTTNNRMEITATIRAVGATKVGSDITIYTDSSYLINGITKWIIGWKKNGWQTKTKQDVLNKDLWQELDHLTDGRNIVWKYVGGHIGVRGNERCDYIATSFADGHPIKLFEGNLTEYPIPNLLNVSYDENALQAKSTKSTKSNIKAYSYVSSVDGVIKIHKTWAECEARVKGQKGAKYRKTISLENEKEILTNL